MDIGEIANKVGTAGALMQTNPRLKDFTPEWKKARLDIYTTNMNSEPQLVLQIRDQKYYMSSKDEVGTMIYLLEKAAERIWET